MIVFEPEELQLLCRAFDDAKRVYSLNGSSSSDLARHMMNHAIMVKAVEFAADGPPMLCQMRKPIV